MLENFNWKNILKKLAFILGFRIEDKVPDDYQPTVSVLIPAYNEERWIGSTIEGVLAQTYPVKKIIVVNDSSEDNTGQLASAYGEVTVVETPEQTGMKAKAQNYGLQFVDTELVVMLDADTVLDEQAIENIVPAMYDDDTFSACGFIIPQKLNSIWETARLIQYLFGISFFKSTQNYWGTMFVVSGCFSIFKTELLRKTNVPEHSVAEDLALTFSAQISGYRTKLVSSAVSYPKDPDNWETYKNQVSRWYRGFFQCLKMYKGGLLKHNKKLLALITGHLASNFLWLFLLFSLIIMTIRGDTGYIVYDTVFYFLIFDFLFTLIIIMFGAVKYKRVVPALKGLPFYWVTMFINNYLFLKAGYNELIKNNELTIWEKGH
ncbi:MAG: glycosyltransferase [Bacillota bacterium]